ncbi:DUF6777 domain-containing protein [Streptomyces sp. NPDC059680]|uniref:DUF6777 domain-containing protein n=1 Tax=Streptomyces sp. NPDC059680 TaxID=3346904 RepID=UPI00367ACE2F
MRIPLGSIAMACALSMALLGAGCARPGVREARMAEEVYLLPAAVQGPDPFTGSTVLAPVTSGAGSADSPATGPPVAGSSPPALPAGLVVVPLGAMRVLSGATPGLYGGTARVAGCDVERQIRYLTADRAKADAFAHAAGVSRSGLPGYLRGLTPVVLRADTRVTDRGYRQGNVVGYQAVLQAGTPILVDNRGMPRLRCACGNPLGSPAPAHGGGFGARGSAWSGYRPVRVIAVTPAPRAVTSITIVNAETRTWIERRVGSDVRHDQVVPPPAWATATPDGGRDPADTVSPLTAPPYPTAPGPRHSRPGTPPPTAATPTGQSTPAAGTAGPRTSPSGGPVPQAPGSPDPPYGTGPPFGIGPPGVPDASGPPDGIAPPGVPDAPGPSDRGGPILGDTPDTWVGAMPGAADGGAAAGLPVG